MSGSGLVIAFFCVGTYLTSIFGISSCCTSRCNYYNYVFLVTYSIINIILIYITTETANLVAITICRTCFFTNIFCTIVMLRHRDACNFISFFAICTMLGFLAGTFTRRCGINGKVLIEIVTRCRNGFTLIENIITLCTNLSTTETVCGASRSQVHCINSMWFLFYQLMLLMTTATSVGHNSRCFTGTFCCYNTLAIVVVISLDIYNKRGKMESYTAVFILTIERVESFKGNIKHIGKLMRCRISDMDFAIGNIEIFTGCKLEMNSIIAAICRCYKSKIFYSLFELQFIVRQIKIFNGNGYITQIFFIVDYPICIHFRITVIYLIKSLDVRRISFNFSNDLKFGKQIVNAESVFNILSNL